MDWKIPEEVLAPLKGVNEFTKSREIKRRVIEFLSFLAKNNMREISAPELSRFLNSTNKRLRINPTSIVNILDSPEVRGLGLKRVLVKPGTAARQPSKKHNFPAAYTHSKRILPK